MAIKRVFKMIHFNIIIKSMRYFLGSVGVRGSVRGPFFTRHLVIVIIIAQTLRVYCSDQKTK